MTSDARVSFGDGGAVDVIARKLGQTLQAIGPLMFRHYRDALGRTFGRHRREWLNRTLARFRRGGLRAGPIGQSSRPSSAAEARRRFFYEIEPQAKVLPAGADASASLAALRGEAYSGSPVAEGLEVGGTFRARGGGWLALPIGVSLDRLGRPIPRWATPEAFRRNSPRGELIALALERGRPPKLYQVVKGRTKRAQSTAGALSLTSDRPRGRGLARALLPAYQLVRQVRRKPLLRFYATWDELQQDRDAVWTAALDRIVREAESG